MMQLATFRHHHETMAGILQDDHILPLPWPDVKADSMSGCTPIRMKITVCMSLRGVKRRSNLPIVAREIATALSGLAMT